MQQDMASSPYIIGLRESLRGAALSSCGSLQLGDLDMEILADDNGVWGVARREGAGGLAIRMVYAPGAKVRCRKLHSEGADHRIDVKSALGRHRITLHTDGGDPHRLRITVSLRAAEPLLIPFMPRDLVPLDAQDDPLGARGNVEAAQRGLNAGLVYFHIDEPPFGNVLYLQNLTALNAYFDATQTKPDGAVGGLWPELGYLLPTPAQSGTPPSSPLPADQEITISDAILVFHDDIPGEHHQSARQFIRMLGAAYPWLQAPAPQCHDWIWRAEKTLADLESSPKALIRHYDHLYAHPYTAVEYPDSMVQLSLLAAMRDYTKWRGRPAAIEDDFTAGLEQFFDTKLGALRRYLPDVGADKDADAVDSWYLYHPLMNLARLALGGDERARDLFLRSIDFAIKAAHHFDYCWPVQFNITNFAVILRNAPADGRGQTDVGGLYAWVMLQAFELTGEDRFLAEAKAALDACADLRFNINYQANLTAWGAAACLRLWRMTGLDCYGDQAHVFLASFFHNSVLWESEIDRASAYNVFLGVTCLQDAPYMAVYECFDSFTAFEHCLRESGEELDPAARLLMGEYCRYALDRAWFYYPDTLPPGLLATSSRNGHIDPSLSFPLEDLYVDGQPAGQVGQEIYGAGAAFIFASRMFHRVEGAPFHLFCDQFLQHYACGSNGAGGSDGQISFGPSGHGEAEAHLALIRHAREPMPQISLETEEGERIERAAMTDDRINYRLAANGRLTLRWARQAG